MDFEWINQITFLQRGIIAGLFIGFICPILGAFLLVRRISIISEALSHITLTGIAAGVFLTTTIGYLSMNPLYLGFFFSIIGSIIVEKLRQVYKDFQELAVPIILSSGIGLSAIFISLSNTGYTEWFNYLFGSIVTVTIDDLYFILSTGIIVIIVLLIFFKELLSISFDLEFAKVSGISIEKLNFIFAILIALVISLSMKIVGIFLVGAMVTIPVATSIQVAKSFKQVMFLGVLFAELAIISGIFFSYHLNIATGGVVVLSSIILLLIVLFGKWLISKHRVYVGGP